MFVQIFIQAFINCIKRSTFFYIKATEIDALATFEEPLKYGHFCLPHYTLKIQITTEALLQTSEILNDNITSKRDAILWR